MPELSRRRQRVDLRSVRRSALAACAALVALSPAAYAAGDCRTVDGYAIYLGVVPAAIAQGHPPEHPERKMHGGAPRGRRQHHVMVAVFDAATGARIDDAVVTATVGEPGLAPVRRRLEPMAIAGAMSYGNYFALSPPGPYRIELQIVRPDAVRPTVATFTYAPAR
jgi:hypothetical protein